MRHLEHRVEVLDGGDMIEQADNASPPAPPDHGQRIQHRGIADHVEHRVDTRWMQLADAL
jgi:hypothetical protein